MGEQRLHSALAPIDLLTRLELEQVLSQKFDNFTRDFYRGLDSARLPTVTSTPGASGTINLGNINTSDGYLGPEQGDLWLLRRLVVRSSSFTDTAKYILFRGSTPSDSSSYSSQFLLEGFTAPVAAIAAPVPSQPAVPATGVAQQNVNQFPVQVVISANGATITNVSVNGITVGTAAGTYTVPANGAISIAYSVATPTWVWSNLNTTIPAVPMGQNVNVGYYPGTKAVLLMPGEQVYAQVFNAVATSTYNLAGEAVRVPAEMRGKVLG